LSENIKLISTCFETEQKSLPKGSLVYVFLKLVQGSSWRDRMVVVFTTTYAISAYHH